MERDVRGLIDDPQFRAYHRELLKPREFNTFDVLQYADYEIRHSNVLAWLLRPGHTHGIGARFLKWFVDQIDKRLPVANADRLPAIGFEASNVAVWRERDHVDITVLFKEERCLIAIENKVGPASSEHVDQVRGYERKLRGKHEGHTVKCVLLTTSPDGSVDFPGLVHVGWKSVHEAIGSFHLEGRFQSCGVRAFVLQYLELVERWFGSAGVEGFKKLLDDYPSILQKMRQVLDKDGDGGVRGMAPEDRADYGDALVMLVKASRQDPVKLRQAVADRLRGQGCELHFTQNNSNMTYWLNWHDTDLADIARRLGCGNFALSWGMTFTHHEVRAGFYLYQEKPEEQPSLDRLKHFLKATPINRRKPDEYVMRDNGFGWYQVYDLEVVCRDELAGMSGHEVKDEVIGRLEDFMGSDESEYRRIDDYFQCLAFTPDDSASAREDSP